MTQLSTFEEIFNKLLQDYQNKNVEVTTKQDGIDITSFQTRIADINIKPLSKRQSKKWNQQGKKVGLMIIKSSYTRQKFNIPFILGFNTMKATFLKNAVIIKTLNMEFIIKKAAKNRNKSA